jgi:hypothetical protein
MADRAIKDTAPVPTTKETTQSWPRITPAMVRGWLSPYELPN